MWYFVIELTKICIFSPYLQKLPSWEQVPTFTEIW